MSKTVIYLQVCVTAREDVPPFGPVLPDPPIFTDVRDRDIQIMTSAFKLHSVCYPNANI